MKIIITGANGFLGGKLIRRLAGEDVSILALGRDEEKLRAALEAEKLPEPGAVEWLSNDAFLSEGSDPGDADVRLVHLAFGRANRGAAEIASGIDFTEKLLRRAERIKGMRGIVYISSQSVYGGASEFRSLRTPVAPELTYAMAKYAGEVLVQSYGARAPAVSTLILRLDYVVQSQNLVRALCRSAITNHRLEIRGGGQCFSYIDADDAADAIAKAVLAPPDGAHIYNVGPDRMRIRLTELAELVRMTAAAHGETVAVDVVPADIEQWAGMDTSDFMRRFGWRPRFGIEDMVARIYEEIQTEICQEGQIS